MTTPPLTLSEVAYVAAQKVAQSRGLTVEAYVESIIVAIAMPEILGLTGPQSTSVEPVTLSSSPLGDGKRGRGPDKKKRKPRKRDGRKLKNWTCPCCAKKTNLNGARMHFICCGLKNGHTVEALADYARQASALGSTYRVFNLPLEEATRRFNEFIDACPAWFHLRDSMSGAERRLKRGDENDTLNPNS